MVQQKVSELTKKLMALVEEKGKDLGWPKKEVLALLKKWQEELAAEGEKLGEALSKKDGLLLGEAAAVFAEFANWQTDRQQEAHKMERELTGLAKKWETVEKELEALISQHQGDKEVDTVAKKKTVRSAKKAKPAGQKTVKRDQTRIAVSP